ncbi:AAA family ATPase [Cohnella cholangitidis]|uniref:AAA family ATPase n=1 Tax=Cohnella cholangitidis TaxID=2598458 RepID=A0A7G5C5G6_9BACL|nr:AAA family ATPase [Cohnella cholangitidis]QMV44450.1 AAA family ATPase [Cohnella cholangitidis]
MEINLKASRALDQLGRMPGMHAVKQQVEQMIQFARIAKLREQQRLKTKPQSNHMVFTGNPGTGKTTAARLIGEAFSAIGLLKNNGDNVPFVEVHHSKITDARVGQTEKNVINRFREARGGVLFIDEAYSFIGESDHRHDDKVVAAMVQCMEDMRDEVVVIAAGYSKEMTEFLSFNPGLSSRFPTTIHFPDYTVPDLIQIGQQMIVEQDFKASPDYLESLKSVLWIEKAKPNFGNARVVRNHIERSIRRQAVRLSQMPAPSRDDLITLRGPDIVHSLPAVQEAEKEALHLTIQDAQRRLLEIDLREILQTK